MISFIRVNDPVRLEHSFNAPRASELPLASPPVAPTKIISLVTTHQAVSSRLDHVKRNVLLSSLPPLLLGVHMLDPDLTTVDTQKSFCSFC
jgi:hypothetical protein